MGVALGWLAVALAASGPGAAPQQNKPEVTYRFQSVEVHGLGWREANGMKLAAQHGSLSVWTAPDDFLQSLPPEARAVADIPADLKGRLESPVHLSARKKQEFTTRVAWNGKRRAPRPIVESVRAGLTATAQGRLIDQGVLTQLVIEDVDVRTVHTLANPAVKQVSATICTEADPTALCPFKAREAAEKCLETTVTVTASMESDGQAKLDWKPSKSTTECQASCEGKHEAKADASTARAGWSAAGEGKIQVPEVGYGRAAGVWLIPHGEVLVIGFGPHTIADADGRAVVREHLALVSADVDLDGVNDFVPTFNDSAEPESKSIPKPVEHPAASPTTEVPRTAAALPSLPGRTLPQPLHPDGTPAPLPKEEHEELPDAAVTDSGSDSAETLATPQTRRKPAPKVDEKPAPKIEDKTAPKVEDSSSKPPISDFRKLDGAAMLKSSLSLQTIKTISALQPLNTLVSSGTLPLPFQGAQFLVPLKPLAVKLPFNQKLEFELIGRVVNDVESSTAFVVGP